MNWKKLIYPPTWLIILLITISIILLIFIFLRGWEHSPLSYIVYIVAFYTLLVVCLCLVSVLPEQSQSIQQKIHRNPLANRYLTDVEFKTLLSLRFSLAINLTYSVFHLLSSIYYSSFWIGAVAIYYILLSVIRFLLLRYLHFDKQDRITKYRHYRFTATLMLLLNLTLSGIIFNMIVRNTPAAYSDIYVIASATYTFYTLTVSLIDILKYRNHHNPILTASKAIRFATALVSLLSLEASMLVQFGNDERFRKMMLSLTGAGVCLVIVSMSIGMMIRATKEIHRIRFSNEKPTSL